MSSGANYQFARVHLRPRSNQRGHQSCRTGTRLLQQHHRTGLGPACTRPAVLRAHFPRAPTTRMHPSSTRAGHRAARTESGPRATSAFRHFTGLFCPQNCVVGISCNCSHAQHSLRYALCTHQQTNKILMLSRQHCSSSMQNPKPSTRIAKAQSPAAICSICCLSRLHWSGAFQMLLHSMELCAVRKSSAPKSSTGSCDAAPSAAPTVLVYMHHMCINTCISR
ncbi:hypothetical protein COO60DRAFT_66663 [Scenedesmus sp. NREL 46B-D3]|nr:hypothetical protein COO60DRAFT_66663 [Scenedesmus sp. NREL 46B-D3]